MVKRSILCGVIGGTILCVPLILIGFLPYFDGMDDWLVSCIILGIIIAPGVLLYKNLSLKHSLLRTVLMFACCLVENRLLGITGVLWRIGDALKIQYSQGRYLAGGFVMSWYLVSILIECAIICFVLLVIAIIKRWRSNRE